MSISTKDGCLLSISIKWSYLNWERFAFPRMSTSCCVSLMLKVHIKKRFLQRKPEKQERQENVQLQELMLNKASFFQTRIWRHCLRYILSPLKIPVYFCLDRTICWIFTRFSHTKEGPKGVAKRRMLMHANNFFMVRNHKPKSNPELSHKPTSNLNP